jgi:TATA-box binding protein (TBP) (component of TFIID and TFIIIB)
MRAALKMKLNFIILIFLRKMDLITNVNYKGDMEHSIDLPSLCCKIPNSKLHRKPHQLVVKDPKGTIIFFQSGKFRVMGCIDELEATFLAYKYTNLINDDEFPPITLQSYTATCDLGFKVLIEKMAATSNTFSYEPELFPALRIREFNPASVHVFTTGKVIVCGLRDAEQMSVILQKLRVLCKPFEY